MLSALLLCFIPGILLICAYLLLRNMQVFDYLNALNDLVYEQSKKDIRNNRDPSWRRKVLNSVKYDEMLFKFWKPLESFYPNKSFINGSTDPNDQKKAK